jgi:uncharacterized protein (UPF0548 family)
VRLRTPRSAPPEAALRALRERPLNYDPSEVRVPEWTFDVHRHHLGREAPGPPEAGGPWEIARALVRDYEFTPPELIRARYDADTPLLGRDLLLEGRFAFLKFQLGVRITAVRDDTDDERRVWGWSYETLTGHLERGRVDYEVVKDLRTGEVEFFARSHSQLDRRAHPVLRLGWALFGRRAQLRFYRRVGERLRALTRARTGIVRVPSDVPPSRVPPFVVVDEAVSG